MAARRPWQIALIFVNAWGWRDVPGTGLFDVSVPKGAPIAASRVSRESGCGTTPSTLYIWNFAGPALGFVPLAGARGPDPSEGKKMSVGIIGRKVGMTQVFDENGALVPVTVVDTSGCVITQVKTKENDGYSALQLAVGDKKPQNVNKALAGHYKKAGTPARALLKEIRVKGDEEIAHLKPGQELGVAMFQKGDRVDVIGTSKGRGFTGVMKRFGFAGKDAGHGTSKYFRHGGSNGSNTFPGRVLKNKGMPGHHGDSRETSQNLLVVDVRPEDKLLLLRGAVPGPKTGLLLVQIAKKRPLADKREWAQA